jgi:formylglycine-generating enzyme required for sulfatase activity
MKTIATNNMDLYFFSPLKFLYDNFFYTFLIAWIIVILGVGCNKEEKSQPPMLPELTFVDIPAGTFIMGNSSVISDTSWVEHQVTVSAFKMSKYEITNAQYAVFLNEKKIGKDGKYANGKDPTVSLILEPYFCDECGLNYIDEKWMPNKGYENHPVINVTWFGADEFATYIGGYLPTEAQWEYACRANTATPFNTGECLSNLQANYYWLFPYGSCENTNVDSPHKTKEVGTFPANAFGLHDMHGNVEEWCRDLYGSYPVLPQTDPTGPTNTKLNSRVARGGAWNKMGFICTSYWRTPCTPNNVFADTKGFRVVRIP